MFTECVAMQKKIKELQDRIEDLPSRDDEVDVYIMESLQDALDALENVSGWLEEKDWLMDE